MNNNKSEDANRKRGARFFAPAGSQQPLGTSEELGLPFTPLTDEQRAELRRTFPHIKDEEPNGNR